MGFDGNFENAVMCVGRGCVSLGVRCCPVGEEWCVCLLGVLGVRGGGLAAPRRFRDCGEEKI